MSLPPVPPRPSSPQKFMTYTLQSEQSKQTKNISFDNLGNTALPNLSKEQFPDESSRCSNKYLLEKQMDHKINCANTFLNHKHRDIDSHFSDHFPGLNSKKQPLVQRPNSILIPTDSVFDVQKHHTYVYDKNHEKCNEEFCCKLKDETYSSLYTNSTRHCEQNSSSQNSIIENKIKKHSKINSPHSFNSFFLPEDTNLLNSLDRNSTIKSSKDSKNSNYIQEEPSEAIIPENITKLYLDDEISATFQDPDQIKKQLGFQNFQDSKMDIQNIFTSDNNDFNNKHTLGSRPCERKCNISLENTITKKKDLTVLSNLVNNDIYKIKEHPRDINEYNASVNTIEPKKKNDLSQSPEYSFNKEQNTFENKNQSINKDMDISPILPSRPAKKEEASSTFHSLHVSFSNTANSINTKAQFSRNLEEKLKSGPPKILNLAYTKAFVNEKDISSSLHKNTKQLSSSCILNDLRKSRSKGPSRRKPTIISEFSEKLEFSDIIKLFDITKDDTSKNFEDNATKPIVENTSNTSTEKDSADDNLSLDVGDLILILIYTLIKQNLWVTQSAVFYILSNIFSWSIIFVDTIKPKHQNIMKSKNLTIYIFQALADIILFFFVLQKPYTFNWKISYSVITLLRILISLFFFSFCLLTKSKQSTLNSEETTLLFQENQVYEDDELSDIKGKNISDTKELYNTWWGYIKRFTLFFPYIWPKNILSLQIIVFFCFILLLISRYINVLTPYQLGIITDQLITNMDDKGIITDQLITNMDDKGNIWISVLLFMFYRFLQGNMGLVSSLRSHLWIPINQYAYKNLSVKAFEHIHSLSLDFHLSKKTGEIMSALDHGSSINTFFEVVIFQVLPVIVDIFIAVIYFFINFDPYFTLIIIVMSISYIYITIKITEWRTEYRRDMVNKHREEYSIKCDSITNYETVKYFNSESFEFNRHEDAVKMYQKAEYNVLSSLNFLNTAQNTIYTIGLLSITFLSAYRVAKNQASVGDFVSLLTYMTQLQGPLNYFGSLYRSLQSSLVDAERMLELFNEKPSVLDKPDAVNLKIEHGESDNVCFSYDKKRYALKALSFHAKAGTSIALVGNGSGKTTVLRCLFKFFNIDSGTIKIDGQDIHDVKLNSLRKSIGIVPQGLRLSGGEKQRIAIARTILKDPKIILLDEATSALDTQTERQVQIALKKLMEGRTTICIAHRLSTITSCNLILCMKDGSIIESGTHEELLNLSKTNKDCLYYSMWQKQIRANKNSEENDKNNEEH
ncbi:hypothetical protein PORY_000734 [Pneumocystis oryctolagi]|uniref:Uncharacterized protein n=1 Tax=Pneumocystis oryctolagi TaxID=42067 RepID=A0ACB7CIU4_9ASCO|nr:hypothetical protein PORY_000734 [Pneumocystis oryctolagi]